MDEWSSLVDRLSELLLLWFCDFRFLSGSKTGYEGSLLAGLKGTRLDPRQGRAGQGKAVWADHHPPTILILAYGGALPSEIRPGP